MEPFTTETSQRLIRDAVTEFSRATGFAVAFGGFESNGVTTVTAQSGAYGESLLSLRVANQRGLGGRAMMEHRPRFTRDYLASQHISHDYDIEISAEGIVMLVAVPVVVDGLTRAVLYGGTRGSASPGERFLSAAAAVAAQLANSIRVEDRMQREQQRLLSALSPSAAIPPADGASPGLRMRGLDPLVRSLDGGAHLPVNEPVLSGPALEEIRRSHAELRQITSEVADPVLRERLVALERRLAAIGKDTSPETQVQLTPREIDVLTHAALGATNAGIGSTLGLTESTVKSYLKTAMAKLDASTRHAAVTAARGQGLIP